MAIGYQEAFFALPADEQANLIARHAELAIQQDADFEKLRASKLQENVRVIVGALAGTPWEKTEEEVRRFLSPQKFSESECSETARINPTLLRPIEYLGLSTTKIFHRLVAENFRYVGELVQESALGLREIPEFSQESLSEIIQALEGHGLTLGTPIPGWRSPNNPLLNRPVSELAFTEDVQRTLAHLGIEYVGDLVRKNWLDFPATLVANGRLERSMHKEIGDVLATHNLELNMRIPDWKRPSD